MKTSLCVVLAVTLAGSGAAQSISVRDLGATRARTAETFGAILGVHQFPDGTVLVNDPIRRQLVLYDSALKRIAVAADSSGSGPTSYGRVRSNLITATPDSVLSVDFATQSLLMRGPGGAVVHSVAPPKVSDLVYILSGTAVLDAKGGLVYRGVLRPPPRAPGTPPLPPIDSVPLVRGDFDTRRVDTLAMLKVPGSKPTEPVRGVDHKVSFRNVINPLSFIDEWGMMADGTVAILRGQDYRIDWINADGTRTSTAKLAYDWKRLTDDDKQKLIDSTRRVYDVLDMGGKGGLTLPEAEVRRGMFNLSLDEMRIVTNADGSKTVPVAIDFVPLNEIPDYVPPIRSGAVRGDADNRLWVLPTTSAQSRKGGLVYDIVSRASTLVERVEIPLGRTVVGFGRGGVVYLMSGDRASGYSLERASYK